MRKIKKLITFIMIFIISVSVLQGKIKTYADNANQKLIVKDFSPGKNDYNSINAVIWNGKKYIAVDSSYNKIYSSNDGISWNTEDSCIYGVKDIACSKNKYTLVGYFVSPSDFPNDKKNIISYGDKGKYKRLLPVASSSNGVKWKAITGSMKNADNCNGGWDPPTTLLACNNKFYHFYYCTVQISTDGSTYKNNIINIKDPKRLTPKGYKYLGKGSDIYSESVIFDGKKFIAYKSDYYGSFILNSKDGINWSVVYFNKNKYLFYELNQEHPYGRDFSEITYSNKKFRIITSKSIVESSDGVKWKEKSLDSLYKNKNVKNLVSKLSNARIYKNSEYLFFQIQKKDKYDQYWYTSKFIVTKDYKNFYEVDLGSTVYGIIYIDKKYMITIDKVYDYKVVKEYINKAKLIK